MCLKLPPENLNPNPYPLHPISIYTHGVITAQPPHKGAGWLHKLLMRILVSKIEVYLTI